MAQYLSKDGLTTLWGKIKSYVANHHDSTKLNLSGGTMTGDILWDSELHGLSWSEGQDLGHIYYDPDDSGLNIGSSDAGVHIHDLANPTSNYDAANKKYVDDHHDSTKADLASPAFTGTPTAPTAASGTNTTQIATTAFVNSHHDSTKANYLDVSSTTTIRLYDNMTNKGQLDPLYKTKIRIGDTTIAAFRIPFGNNRNKNFIGTTLSSLLTLHCDLLSGEQILSASGMCCIGGKRYAVGIQIAGQYCYFRGPVLNNASTNITGTIANNDYIFMSYVGLIV